LGRNRRSRLLRELEGPASGKLELDLRIEERDTKPNVLDDHEWGRGLGCVDRGRDLDAIVDEL
jgi:hypothetical protein